MTEQTATPTTVTMYGADWCIDCRRSKAVLDADGVAYEYVNLEEVPEAADIAKSISGRTNIPVIVFPDGTHLVEPSDAQLRDALATF
jgi:glutaredoxin-like protein